MIENLVERIPSGGLSIAYLILVHEDPSHFARLVRRLWDPRAIFFVHVDKKVDIGPFQSAVKDIPAINFVTNRVRVMWAAYSQVEATLRTFEEAIALTNHSCDRFVLLSGTDYPLANNDKIFEFFQQNVTRQFIRRFDIVKSGNKRQIWRIKAWHFRELANRNTWKRRPLYLFETILSRILRKRLPDNVTFTAGSNWCALTRDCVKYCISEARINKQFTAAFRFMFGSDEIFFHTLIENSVFKRSAGPIEPYYDVTELGGPWRYGNIHFLKAIVPITSVEEINTILHDRDGKLFARKFTSADSIAVLAMIDKHLDGEC